MAMFRDPSLPHQIKLTIGDNYQIVVGCNCGAVLGSQYRWDNPREPARLWREHMSEDVEVA